MDRRYQIFVSSTFRDLKAEREAALNAILEMGHFPAGMEAFTASNETAWAIIQRTIQDCDYYVLIIGGRYGSAGPDGLSYTEREYDLAISLGIPVVPQLHRDPEKIEVGKSEKDAEARQRLEQFRKKVEDRHHCKYWENASDLKSKILLSLQYMIRIDPRVGWVRADGIDNIDLLKQINELRIRLQTLEQENSSLKAKLAPLAQQDLDRSFELKFRLLRKGDGGKIESVGEVTKVLPLKTWFLAVAPFYLHGSERSPDFALESLAKARNSEMDETLRLVDSSRTTLMLELTCQELVEPIELPLVGRQGQSSIASNIVSIASTRAGWKLTHEGRLLYGLLSKNPPDKSPS